MNYSEPDPADQNAIQPPTPDSNPSDKHDNPPPPPALIADMEPPHKDKAQTEHCRPDKTPTAKTVLEVLAVAVVFAYTFAAFWQLGVMRDQLREIIRQYPEIKKSADAAKTAADTARQTLTATGEQFRLDQRPYVWLSSDIGGPFFQAPHIPGGDISDRLCFSVNFTNYGKTPALNSQSDLRIAIGKEAKVIASGVENIKWKVLDPHTGSVLPPGKANMNTACADKPTEPVAVRELLQRLMTPNTQGWAVVYGRFQYSGLDGTVYSSEFCIGRNAVSPGGPAYPYCNKHNGI